jgi:hypothetical protein
VFPRAQPAGSLTAFARRSKTNIDFSLAGISIRLGAFTVGEPLCLLYLHSHRQALLSP